MTSFFKAAAFAIAGLSTLSWMEAEASACLLSTECSTSAPVCDLLSHTCRSCGNDVECGAPLSGKTCATSGADKGQCVGECTLANSVACVGKLDTPVCVGNLGACGCNADGDCVSGSVCDKTQGTAGKCIAGCHVSLLGDTCAVGAQCSVLDGRVGVCVQLPKIDSGLLSCIDDLACGGLGSGLVCDTASSSCVVGCRVNVGGDDSCPVGAHCSVLGGSIGVCLGNTVDADAGSDASAGDAGAASDAGSDASDIDAGSHAGDVDAGVDASAGDGNEDASAGDAQSASTNDAGAPVAAESPVNNDALNDTGVIAGGGCACNAVPSTTSPNGLVGLLASLLLVVRGRRANRSHHADPKSREHGKKS